MESGPILALTCAATLFLALAACGGTQDETPTEASSTQRDTLFSIEEQGARRMHRTVGSRVNKC